MQKLDLKPYYDVIIIGAGVGGLTAAALLSKAGFSVCVLEKEPHVGGYLAGFRRRDFRFDTAIHWLNQCNADGLVGRVFDMLGTDHPVAIPQKRIRRYKGDSFDYLLTDNPDELRDRLIGEYPHEKKGLVKFFRAAWNLGKSFDNYSNVFRTEESMSFFEKFWNKLRLLKFVIPFIPYVTYSGEKGLHKGLNKFFKEKAIQNIFASETELLSCLIPIGWAYFGDFQSPPKGGGQVIPEWLLHIVEYYKSVVNCKCRVTEILLDDNRCKGVAFEHRGARYEINSQYVIAACDVETLYEKMLPAHAVPAKLKKKLKEAELYSSSVTVSIALDCTAESLGFDEELVHIVSEQLPFDVQHGGDPVKSEISILAPSLRDKSLAPQGQGTLVLFMPAFMEFSNNWSTAKDPAGNFIQGEEYRKLKNVIAEKIIDRVVEKLVPDLRAHILFYEAATPVTHWRYTGNKNGTMMGAKPGRENMQSKIAHYRTPVKNLILGGHWAELGGGVPIAVKAGANASLLILKEKNKPAFNLLAAYMDSKIGIEEFRGNSSFKPYDNSWKQKPTPAQKHAALKLI
jgi:phytoene dehydrogenase-like protein